MKYAILAFSIFALIVTCAISVWHQRETRKDLPAFLAWTKDDGIRNDCGFGFRGSVIYHNELAKSQGRTPANEDQYLSIKAECARL